MYVSGVEFCCFFEEPESRMSVDDVLNEGNEVLGSQGPLARAALGQHENELRTKFNFIIFAEPNKLNKLHLNNSFIHYFILYCFFLALTDWKWVDPSLFIKSLFISHCSISIFDLSNK